MDRISNLVDNIAEPEAISQQHLCLESIFSVMRLNNGKIRWTEECDRWFEEDLTIEESLKLLEEIRDYILSGK